MFEGVGGVVIYGFFTEIQNHVPGWMVGSKNHFKDCLQQSKSADGDGQTILLVRLNVQSVLIKPKF